MPNRSTSTQLFLLINITQVSLYNPFLPFDPCILCLAELFFMGKHLLLSFSLFCAVAKFGLQLDLPRCGAREKFPPPPPPPISSSLFLSHT